MRIAEIFESRQGEGLLTGQASLFVRTSGCNLRCWFCDTPYTSWSPEGDDRSVDDIVELCRESTLRHVVVTGGEPMMWPEVSELTRQMRELEWHITIETAGTIARDVSCDLMSISPKLGNSVPRHNGAGKWADRHNQQRIRPGVIDQLVADYPYQFKFVVDDPSDLEEIQQFLSGHSTIDPDSIWLMPQGTEVAELDHRKSWLEPYCAANGFRFADRMHIRWYGNKRGT